MAIKHIRKIHVGWAIAITVGSLILAALGIDNYLLHFSQWPPQNPDIKVCETGAWGRVWYDWSVIEIPPRRIKIESFQTNSTVWYIAARTSAQMVSTLQTCGLEPQQIQDLLVTSSPAPDGVGRLLHPSGELLLSLSDPARRQLYGILGAFSQNAKYCWPFRFSGDPSSDWFKGSNIDPAMAELVRALVYHEGNLQMFSDLDFVMEHYPSATTYSNLFCVLSRESTLVAHVRVLPGDDVDALAHYWGYPRREDEVRTLMKTLQGTDACRDVPVSMLLPRFARDRIYRYWQAGDPDFPDCHYTAMNFLNDKAEERFTNTTEVAKVMMNDYVEVTQDYKLGDLILLMKNEKGVVHSCNYVADGIVFTRNGGGVDQPWLLTKLDAIVDYYSYPDPVHVKILRRRDLCGQ